MKSASFSVSGMVNSESKTKLLNALNKIEGIQNSYINIKQGTVSIDYNAPATKYDIEQCIEHTGYNIE